MVVPWIVFPLVLAVLCLGCGLLVTSVAPYQVPAALVMPIGFATAGLAAQFALVTASTAQLAAPLVVALACSGFAVGFPRALRRVVGPWLVAAVGVFAAYAAPVVLAGRATFLGYIKLDDTATYFAMLDRALGHGYSLRGLAPSTYEATVSFQLGHGYPLGSILPLGVGHELTRTDLAWTWQPYIALLGALLALSLYALAASVLRSRWLCVLASLVGSQAALIYGYALWGGVKELAVAILVVAASAIVVPTARVARRPLAVIPLAVVMGGIVDVLSVGGAAWLLPIGGAVLILGLARARVAALVTGAALAVTTAAVAAPAVFAAFVWLPAASGYRSADDFGNLVKRLDAIQVFGVWFNGDFRYAPADATVTHVLIAVVAIGAAIAVAYGVRERSWALLVALAAAACASVVYGEFGGPWIAGKALASSSPILVTAALVGAGAWFERGRRVEAAVIAAFVVGGVGWSDVLQYRNVLLAPNTRLAELEQIGKRFAGLGPTLLTQFDSYGARHFLRAMTPEAASELRRHYVYLRDGTIAATGVSPDIDEIRLDQVLIYRMLVLPRSGSESRPPSIYHLVWNGRWYQVWEKAGQDSTVIEHLSLGDRLQPSAVPDCGDVLRLGREAARAGGSLAAVRRPKVVVFQGDGADTSASVSPASKYGQNPHSIFPTKATTVTKSFEIAAAGTYRVWVGGSYTTRIDVTIDGHLVGRSQAQLNWPGNFVDLGALHLARGRHSFRLVYHGPDWRPGSSAPPPFGLGPFVIGQDDENLPVTRIAPASARRLCGAELDWVEAVR